MLKGGADSLEENNSFLFFEKREQGTDARDQTFSKKAAGVEKQ